MSSAFVLCRRPPRFKVFYTRLDTGILYTGPYRRWLPVCVMIMVNHLTIHVALLLHPLPLFLPTYMPVPVSSHKSHRHRTMFFDNLTAAQSEYAVSQLAISSNLNTKLDSLDANRRGGHVGTAFSDKATRSVSFISPPPSLADQDGRSISVTVEKPMTANTSATE